MIGSSVVPAVHALDVTATIPVRIGAEAIVYDSGKGELFVANYYDSTVSVISDSSYTVVATINLGTSPLNSVGNNPSGIAYDFSKGEIFVTNKNANSVSVISDNSNSVVATINVGNIPKGVAYDPAKGEIFVANSGSNTVSVISDTNNSVVATVNVGERPVSVACDSAMGEVFVSNLGIQSGLGTISVISESNNTVIATIDPVIPANGLIYDPGKDEIFAISGGEISIISDHNNTIIKHLTPPIVVTNSAYDAAKNVIFFSGFYFGIDAQNRTLCVLSDKTNTFLETLSLSNTRSTSYGVAYDDAKGEVFLTDVSGKVFVISDSSLPAATPNPTQTISPSPTVPEFSTPAIVFVMALLFLVVAIVQSRKQRIDSKLSSKFNFAV